MLSDGELADLCAAAYQPGWQPTWNTDDIHFGLVMRDRTAIVVGQGSKSTEDWLRDFDAIPRIPRQHPQLGEVHPGLFGDVEQIVDKILSDLSGHDDVYVTGHSKAAAEAQGIAVHFILANRSITKVSTFAPPRIGSLGGLIANLPGVDYRYCSDPVPGVPPYLPHPRQVTHIGGDDHWADPLPDHHVSNYQRIAVR